MRIEHYSLRGIHTNSMRKASMSSSIRGCTRLLSRMLCMLMFLALAPLAPSALAQAPAAGTDTQFDVLGFIEEATLDPCGDALCGGKIRVNGHSIIIPANTIVILPANALTWKELFLQAPAPYTNIATGMALADMPAPLASYEAHVIGNQVDDSYIAGLVTISQQATNTGTGYINFIDYASGEIRVGGRLVRDGNGVPQNTLDSSKPGIRIRINDPSGRFARVMSPDPRFTIDTENPTVRSVTGFPMCLPRSAPTSTQEDALCPQANRPKDTAGRYIANFTMPDPATLAAGQLPDPRIMAPFEVGDHVTYSGTLIGDAGSAGPFRSADGSYISAHTLISNVAIFTAPFTDPAYVAIDVSLLGNGGVTIPANTEAVVRTRFEGMSTDPSRNIRLFGIDVAPDGTTSDRDWGIVAVDPGAPAGAVKGRWRFQPPCTGLFPTIRFCVGPLDEITFLPATREVRAVIDGAWTPAGKAPERNGLIAGQYHAPIAEYLFEENQPGTPPPPIKFATIPFLAKGGYSSSTGVVAGPLKPWPGSSQPVSCNAPVASAGSNITVASGTKNVPLSGSATGSGPFTYSWTAPSGILLAPSASVPNPTFTAPTVVATNTFPFTLDVVGCNGQKSSATIMVTVTPPQSAAPVITPIAPTTVTSGTTVTLTANVSSSNPLSYSWTQTSGPPQSFTQQNGGKSIRFAHALATNKVSDDVLAFTVVATDTVTRMASQPVTATVTFTPLPDTDTITVAEYRTLKQRLDVTAVSSVVNPNVVLTLQPYTTTGGAVFDPATVGNALTNNGAGNYTITLVGVPQPGPAATLVVKSNIGGSSAPTALTKLRTN
jgi:hypothetical protein